MKYLNIALVAFVVFSPTGIAKAQGCGTPAQCYESAIELLKQRSDEIDSMKSLINDLRSNIEDLKGEITSFRGGVVGFNSGSCPSGWKEYKAGYGRFLRGIDKSAAKLDPDGRREPGSFQGQSMKAHHHKLPGQYGSKHAHFDGGSRFAGLHQQHSHGPYIVTSQLVGGKETRPANVAVLFCTKE